MSGQIPCDRPFCWQCLVVAAAVVGVIAWALLGCAKREEGVVISTNSKFKVERLFSHEGCTVYYKARRWLASEERRDRRNLPWGVSFNALDQATKTEVSRRGFKNS